MLVPKLKILRYDGNDFQLSQLREAKPVTGYELTKVFLLTIISEGAEADYRVYEQFLRNFLYAALDGAGKQQRTRTHTHKGNGHCKGGRDAVGVINSRCYGGVGYKNRAWWVQL